MRIDISTINDSQNLYQILSLQQKNLPHNISKEEAIEQGFVTVEHTLDILKQMQNAEPSVIAKHNNEVIGYALVMLQQFKTFIPVLAPMFQMIDQIDYNGKKLSAYHYFVMGQVCIDKNYRGLGIFDKLYFKLKEAYQNKYQLLITEVAKRNQRSIKAHQRVGLKTIHEYSDDRGEVWEIMIREFRNASRQ
ncbi:MAG: GNAT family N-acetyltransferase [Fimbriimonadaceae bacterium]|nr:GNAT family N-acetyltransferase [Chitinophagales bacterium]